jgi:hypothetical protein
MMKGMITAILLVIFLCRSNSLFAQERLGAAGPNVTASPAFESWSFGSAGLAQPGSDGTSTVFLSSARQISVPLVFTLPLAGDRWIVDVATAYAIGEVKLTGNDPSLNADSYSVKGLSDTRLRLTGKLFGDNVVATLAANVPTGKTDLNAEELSALRVVASPALGFQIPILGSGIGATAGLVVARRINDWAWALGASYEMRGRYAPVAIVAGLAAPEFDPGDVIHLSLGGDGLAGRNGMSVGLSADLFSKDLLASDEITGPTTQLGPIITAEWRLRIATTRLEELTLSVVDRLRTSYKSDGATVSGSSGNYLDVGLLGVYPATPQTGIAWEVSARHQTGLKVDNSLATAAAITAALRLSVSHELRGGAVLQPFARVQMGKFKNGDESASATGISVGLTVIKGW